jgi:tetratricopeptide (TPR) repeat protein
MQDVTSNRLTGRDHFELVIRLHQSRNSSQADANLRLRAQALVKDILMSRLDVDADLNAHEYVQTQGFGDLGKALAASRALQVAFEGFRNAIPSGRANISMILDAASPEEAASQPSPSVEQKDLLDSAKPSQVLITQAFYDRIAHCQPALRSYPRRAGIYEFLWTSEQRLNELQAEMEFAPTLIQPMPTAETVIVQPVGQAPTPRWKELEATLAPPPEPVYEDPVPARRLSTARVFAIGGAVAFVIAVGYLVTSHVFGNPSPPVVQSTHPQQPPVAPPQPQVPTPPKPGGSPTSSPQGQVTPPPPPKQERSRVSDNDGSSQPASESPTKARGCSIGGEVPAYLNLAEMYRSRGNYERAISNFNLVLGCEPGNREARDGLHKAEEAEKYSSR